MNISAENKLPDLPNWVTLPELTTKPIYRIVDKGESFGIETLPELNFDLPSAASDYITETLNGHAVFFSSELKRASSLQDNWNEEFFFEEDSEEAGGRLLISFVLEVERNNVREAYADFLEQNEKYSAAPDNWFVAYQWLLQHPLFWHKIKTHPNMWITDQGLDDVQASVFEDEDGIVVLLEGGPYQDEYTQPTLDLSLSAWGRTFEEAYLGFAQQINKYYTHEGVAREGVPYSESFNGKSWFSSIDAAE